MYRLRCFAGIVLTISVVPAPLAASTNFTTESPSTPTGSKFSTKVHFVTSSYAWNSPETSRTTPTSGSALGSSINWCTDMQCKKQHTMCKHPKAGPGPKCVKYAILPITAVDMEGLLGVHNRWRDWVASGNAYRSNGGSMPQAANMGVLTWNPLIGVIAQRHADQCVFGHDPCRDLPSMLVGQNVAEESSVYGGHAILGFNMSSLISGMYYEIHYFSVPLIDGTWSNGDWWLYGHFTQMVWAETYQVGCGASSYLQGKSLYYLVVCNYAPTGNFPGYPIYKRGRYCTKCPKGTTCGGDKRYPHLCNADGGKLPDFKSATSKSAPISSLIVTVAATYFIGKFTEMLHISG